MGRLASNAEANPSIARLLALLLPPAFALYGTFNGVQQIVLPLQVEQNDQSGKVGHLAQRKRSCVTYLVWECQTAACLRRTAPVPESNRSGRPL